MLQQRKELSRRDEICQQHSFELMVIFAAAMLIYKRSSGGRKVAAFSRECHSHPQKTNISELPSKISSLFVTSLIPSMSNTSLEAAEI